MENAKECPKGIGYATKTSKFLQNRGIIIT